MLLNRPGFVPDFAPEGRYPGLLTAQVKSIDRVFDLLINRGGGADEKSRAEDLENWAPESW